MGWKDEINKGLIFFGSLDEAIRRISELKASLDIASEELKAKEEKIDMLVERDLHDMYEKVEKAKQRYLSLKREYDKMFEKKKNEYLSELFNAVKGAKSSLYSNFIHYSKFAYAMFLRKIQKYTNNGYSIVEVRMKYVYGGGVKLKLGKNRAKNMRNIIGFGVDDDGLFYIYREENINYKDYIPLKEDERFLVDLGVPYYAKVKMVMGNKAVVITYRVLDNVNEIYEQPIKITKINANEEEDTKEEITKLKKHVYQVVEEVKKLPITYLMRLGEGSAVLRSKNYPHLYYIKGIRLDVAQAVKELIKEGKVGIAPENFVNLISEGYTPNMPLATDYKEYPEDRWFPVSLVLDGGADDIEVVK